MNKDRLQMWDDCLKIFKDNLSPEQYRAWFEPISCVSCDKDEIVLHVPSEFFIEQLEAQYYNLIGRTLYRVFGSGMQLRYQFNQVHNDPTTSVTMADSNPSPAVTPRPGATSNPFARTEETEIDPQLNPRYTFENYCGSMSNQVPRAIGEAIAS
ncbi:MAG: chromosomal replication initiator protein DnaA, partial [Paramuribaculum sp.]|nr:chromosomal replication initiator protein DnaA [Paramuribaculum sp.]